MKVKNIGAKTVIIPGNPPVYIEPGVVQSLETPVYEKLVSSGELPLLGLEPLSKSISMETESQEELTDEERTKLTREVEKIFIRKIHSRNFWACLFSAIPKIPVQHIRTVRLRWDLRYQYGVCLEYNPQFLVQQYQKDERLLDYCIAHEGAHLVLRHMARWLKFKEKHAGYPDRLSETRFNIATDLAVNELAVMSILDDGKSSTTRLRDKARQFLRELLPNEHTADSFGFAIGKSWEQYYQLLTPGLHIKEEDVGDIQIERVRGCWSRTTSVTIPREQEPVKVDAETQGKTAQQSDLNLPKETPPAPYIEQETTLTGLHDWDLPEIDPDDEDVLWGGLPEDIHSEIVEGLEDRLMDYVGSRVSSYEKSVGKLPGAVREVIKDSLHKPSPISWKSLLANMLKSGKPADDDVTYGRWNRRLLHLKDKGILPLPGSEMSFQWSIALIQDTSGSMSPAEIEECNNVVLSLMKHDPSLEIYVIQADTHIRQIYSVKRAKDLKTEVLGRGGTDFRQAIHEVEKDLQPDVLVYCTDGWGTAPARKPATPIIWCVPKNHNVPANYGRVVRMDTGQTKR